MEQKKNNLKLVWGVIIVFIYLIIAFIFVFAPNSIFKENTLWVRVAMGILVPVWFVPRLSAVERYEMKIA